MQIISTLILVVVIFYAGTGISTLIEPIIVIPGNLIGMGILYLLLQFKVIKLQVIDQTGSYLLRHMSLFFIPFGVSILSYYDLIKGDIIALLLITVISTTFSMWLTSKVIDLFVKRRSV